MEELMKQNNYLREILTDPTDFQTSYLEFLNQPDIKNSNNPEYWATRLALFSNGNPGKYKLKCDNWDEPNKITLTILCEEY